MGMTEIYRKHHKKLLLIPAALFIVYLVLAFWAPGIKYGMDFRGGILVTFNTSHPIDAKALEDAVKGATGVSEVHVIPTVTVQNGKEMHGGIVEVVYPENMKLGTTAESNSTEAAISVGAREEGTQAFQDKVLNAIKSKVPYASNITVRSVAPSLGATFWKLATNMAIWAFILLVIGVYIFFRQMKPTLIMIGSAIFDGLGMLALMALFNIPLTLSTIVIILMMIGYSIDTDIVLSTHLLKRSSKEEGDAFERAGRAASTGIHMSGTTLTAMIIIYLVGYFTSNLSVLRIANVMIFGVLSDLIVTWFLNAPVMIEMVRKHESSTA
jgi:preprotein translocase subunit SecF